MILSHSSLHRPEPRPRDRSARRSPRSWLPTRAFTVASLLASLALALFSPLGAQTIANDDLFLKSLRAAVQSIEQYGVYDNPAEAERVNRIGYQLAARSGFEDYPFTFTLIDMPIPNAFALPAGQIFVTRGMLDLGLDDEMLAALLGHEIAHVTETHFLRMKKKATLLNTLSSLLVAGALYGATQANDDTYVGPYGVTRDDGNAAALAQGAIQAGMLATELLMRGYSREHEDEADEQGQRFAATAGYDPDGARRLMATMSQRMPQTEAYGYLHTHPFLEDRARAAAARKGGFKVEERADSSEYRRATQRVLLDFVSARELDPELVQHLESAALAVWPQGPEAERLRLERLHRERDAALAELGMQRDLGALIEAYRRELEEVESLTPDSALLPRLRDEVGELRQQLAELYPQAVRTFEQGVYQTTFLETFRSNWPESPQAAAVSLELGKAYSRLGRETEAVEHFLQAWRSDQPELAAEAGVGLRNLAPILTRLGALQSLTDQEEDAELQRVARERLADRVSSYEEIENGAEYLRRYPDGEHAEVVRERLDELADALYKKMVLYQRVGDMAKAVEQARRILTYAPLSPAAEQLAHDALDDDDAA